MRTQNVVCCSTLTIFSQNVYCIHTQACIYDDTVYRTAKAIISEAYV